MTARLQAIVMNGSDTVATLLGRGGHGEEVSLLDSDLHPLGTIDLREDIARFHKVAIQAMEAGDRVVKFGEIIGKASTPIAVGECVHVSNVISARL